MEQAVLTGSFQNARLFALRNDCSDKDIIAMYKSKNSKENIIMRENDMIELAMSPLGNDIKQILAYGETTGNVPLIKGTIDPPKPSELTYDDIGYNLGKYGFYLNNLDGRVESNGMDVHPEYLFAAILFERNMRRIDSGLPVLLCRGKINYPLLMFVARKYRFAGRLFDLLSCLKTCGVHNLDATITVLNTYNIKPVMPNINIVREAMRVYGC